MKKIDVARLNQAIRPAIRGMKPPENLTVSQWADKNRRLSRETAAEPGPWRTSRTPYLKDILDSFNDPNKTDFWINVTAELNMMMKMMLGSKIKEALDKVVDGLVDASEGRMPAGIDPSKFNF